MDFSKLDAFLDEIAGTRVPSTDCVVFMDHKMIHRHISGYINNEEKIAPTGDELYYMFSSSKPVTCAAALILLERGCFSLNDPVSNYMPEFGEMKVLMPDGSLRAPASPIKIRHLFTMTSGLDYDLSSKPLFDAIEESGGRCPTRDIVRAIAKRPLLFDPGTKWMYGLSHDILAALVEVISGVRFADFVQANIFDRVGMPNSHFHLTEDEMSKLPPMYIYDNSAECFKPTRLVNDYVFGEDYDAGGAGIISTVEDMAKFSDMLACGGVTADDVRILRPETVRMMHTNCLTPELLPSFNWTQYIGYGYGLGVRTLITQEYGARSPIGEFGWAGAAGSYTLCDCENRLSLFCARHMLNNKEPEISPYLRDFLYEALSL